MRPVEKGLVLLHKCKIRCQVIEPKFARHCRSAFDSTRVAHHCKEATEGNVYEGGHTVLYHATNRA